MKKRRLLSALLSLAMAATMLPAVAVAADTSGGGAVTLADTENDDLVLNKTAKLEDDGTYTINLDAYATGETQTITTQEPTDIVLVLDVSGSMDDDITYSTGKQWVETSKKVKDCPTDVYHKCPDGTYSTITWTEQGVTGLGMFRYVCDHCKATRKYRAPLNKTIPGASSGDSWNLWEYTETTASQKRIEALQNAAKAFVDSVAAKNMAATDVADQHRVSIVKFASATTKDTVGNDRDNNGYNYTQVVDDLTVADSTGAAKLNADIDALQTGGATAADKGLKLAQSVLAKSNDGRKKVVILFTDGSPTHSNGFENDVASNAVTTAKTIKDQGATVYTIGVLDGADVTDTTSNINKYMNAVSSNYPSASVTDASSFTVSLDKGGNNGYYKKVTNATDLDNIFTEISHSIGTTTVTLGANAVAKDIMADGFDLTNATVTAEAVNYSGRDKNGNRVFGNATEALSATKAGNTVSVTGFDYAKDYLLDGDSVDSNNDDFRTAKQGKKLHITITGVEATDGAITNGLVSTNGAASGVYENANAATAAALFPQPKTELSSKYYVLDYAKEAQLTGMPNTVTHIADDMKQFTSNKTSLKMKYGNATTTSYTPKTTNWNGYDSYYGFGKWTTTPDGVTTGDNTWTKVSVIPANNVYYEDTFVTNEGDGTVGIVYTGEWETVTAPGRNTETANGDEQGWETSLSDDTGYSDGTAATGRVGTDGVGATTATFTFTGRGVDIYSRTNMETGLVRAQLYQGEQTTAAKMTKSLIVDNLAQSGDYYQIPTVSFSDLEYGTYTVKLTVGTSTTAATDSKRSTYYLDGIRVYNPLSDKTEQNDDVTEAYDDEIGATFQSVRNMLLDAKSFDEQPEEDGNDTVTGAVFIDYIPGTGTGGTATTANIGTYTNYGPKNEVYLAKGQAIAFRVPDTVHLAVGLKAPEKDKTTTAEVTDGVQKKTLNINTSSDLYYEITPNENGYVVIKNTGENLLSVTKIKTSGEAAEAGSDTFAVSRARLMSYANEFDSLPVVEETPTTPENPEVTTPDEGGDVVIDNPEETAPEETNPVANWISNLFGGIKKLFGR